MLISEMHQWTDHQTLRLAFSIHFVSSTILIVRGYQINPYIPIFDYFKHARSIGWQKVNECRL
jgi:hypothetical protein